MNRLDAQDLVDLIDPDKLNDWLDQHDPEKVETQ